jgi:hypothetical protein
MEQETNYQGNITGDKKKARMVLETNNQGNKTGDKKGARNGT